MRPSLSRAPGLLLCAALVLAPNLAWAAPIRTNLGQNKATTTEVRWQPTSQTEVVTDPWQLTGSTTRIERSQSKPQVAHYQEIRTDSYRQRTTAYPQEAKEQRTKTTTTQDYELRTYEEQSTSSTVMIPVTKEVGEWVTTQVEKPVTTPIQSRELVDALVTRDVPVWKTLTATYSIPGKPLYTPLNYTRWEEVPKTEKVTKTRTETYTTTKRVLYNSHMYDASSGKDLGTVVMWNDEKGISLDCPDYRVNVNMRFTDTAKTKLTYTIEGGWGRVDDKPTLDGNCVVTKGSDCDYLEFDGDPRFLLKGNWWWARVKVKLNNHLAYDKTETATREVSYVEDVVTSDSVPHPATASLQLEKMTNHPQERQGATVTEGVYWAHFHHPQLPCPYDGFDLNRRRVYLKTGTEVPVYREWVAAQYGPVVGNLVSRVEATVPLTGRSVTELNTESTFTLVAHHTDVMPVFADDYGPDAIATRDESVIDHYEPGQVWEKQWQTVIKQVPVQQVVNWENMGPKYEYTHSHTDPTIRCSNAFPKTSKESETIFTHARKPVFAPISEVVSSQEWATHSVTVTEPRTVTSTMSVLVSAVPGQDISSSYSPWTETGEKRRAGTGSVKDATRSTEVAGLSWNQDTTAPVGLEAQTLQAQASSYISDLSSGSGRQAINGTSVRRALKAKEAISSQPRAATSAGSLSAAVPVSQERPGQGNSKDKDKKDK